ncbi:nitroreductase [Gammaproteobacteria bacterium]|nr:nitroreductase [Gammaproteobacteria bacterium]
MQVSKAVQTRHSVRSFTNDPVENNLLEKILIKASRSPSGGNLQPWKIYVINKKSMQTFLSFQEKWEGIDEPSYEIYPKDLKQPYKDSRNQLGEEMYNILGIKREDKTARINQVLENFKFFGAPAAIFCFVENQMGPPQWSDLGMFLQTFMLLAKEAGLDTCAQEAWSIKNKSVSEFFQSEDSEMLFCAVAIGYENKKAKINSLKSNRRKSSQWLKFV